MQTEKFLTAFPDTIFQVFKDKGKDMKPQQFTEYDQAKFRKLNEHNFGIYFTPNGFKGKRQKKNLSKLNAVFADLDIAKTGDESTEKERDTAKLKVMKWLKATLIPHVIIITRNGLQAIWLIDEDRLLDAEEEYKDIIEGIIYQSTKVGCAGDHVKDVSRVLRLPGYFHMKQEPFRCSTLLNQIPRYKLSDFPDAFPQKEKPVIYSKQPKNRLNLYHKTIDDIDFQELIIAAYLSTGVKAEFDSKGRVIEDGRLTGTFQGKNGDRRFLASTSHDPKEGNQITAVAAIKGCTNKEAVTWIKEEFDLEEKVVEKKVKAIQEHNEVDEETGGITETGIPATEHLPYTWGTDGLDKKMWALKKHQYCMVAGLYNSGKTAYVFDLARKNAILGHKVMYFILEMSRKELYERIATDKAGVGIEDDRMETLSDEQKKIYTKTIAELKAIKNLEIVEIPRSVKGDIHIIIEAIEARKPGMVIIDNLGKIAKSDPAMSDYASETEISDQILKFTNEAYIPVLLVHHLNAKKTSHGRKADMSQIRGSGKLADDADIALFVERDTDDDVTEMEKAAFIIKTKKNRRKGDFAICQVYFKEGSFYDEFEYDKPHYDPQWWAKE